MSSNAPHSIQEEIREFRSEHPLRQILLGLLIIAISATAWFAINWYKLRTELADTQQELRLLKVELTDAQQRLEAQLVINRRQAEMLKAATEAPPHP